MECALAGIAFCRILLLIGLGLGYLSFSQDVLPASLTHSCRCAIRHLWLQSFIVLLPIVPQMLVWLRFSWQRIWLPCFLKSWEDGNFHGRMKILLSPAYLLKTLGFVVKKLYSGWLAGAWSSSLPNFGFQVSSKNDTGPVLCGSATNGISCLWPSKPWA